MKLPSQKITIPEIADKWENHFSGHETKASKYSHILEIAELTPYFMLTNKMCLLQLDKVVLLGGNLLWIGTPQIFDRGQVTHHFEWYCRIKGLKNSILYALNYEGKKIEHKDSETTKEINKIYLGQDAQMEFISNNSSLETQVHTCCFNGQKYHVRTFNEFYDESITNAADFIEVAFQDPLSILPEDIYVDVDLLDAYERQNGLGNNKSIPMKDTEREIWAVMFAVMCHEFLKVSPERENYLKGENTINKTNIRKLIHKYIGYDKLGNWAKGFSESSIERKIKLALETVNALNPDKLT
jgi:hypothetical protein